MFKLINDGGMPLEILPVIQIDNLCSRLDALQQLCETPPCLGLTRCFFQY